MTSRPNCFLCTAGWNMLIADTDQGWRGNGNMYLLPRSPLKTPNCQLRTFSALFSYLCVLGTQQRLGSTTFLHWGPLHHMPVLQATGTVEETTLSSCSTSSLPFSGLKKKKINLCSERNLPCWMRRVLVLRIQSVVANSLSLSLLSTLPPSPSPNYLTFFSLLLLCKDSLGTEVDHH